MFIDTVTWNPQTAPALAETAARFGFTGIAFNVDVSPSSSSKGTQSAAITNPIKRVGICHLGAGGCLALSRTELDQVGLTSHGGEAEDPNLMIQISRVTVKISDPSQIGFLNSISRAHQFDLVAVSPEDERSWNVLLSQGDFDIMKLDLTSGRVPFPLRRHQLTQLARRGVSFDICLSGAIQDSTARRHLFTNIQQLVRFLPKDKLFLTSGATHPLGLRAPMDLINIAQLMGFRDKPQAVIGENTMACVYKSAARRTAGGMVGIAVSAYPT